MSTSTTPEPPTRDWFLSTLEALVSFETPSNDLTALGSGLDALATVIESVAGSAPERVWADGRAHLRWGSSARPDVLLLGHLDTVWPLGTTATWPFSVSGTTATGPGVFDMKAGLVSFLHALQVTGDPARVALLITTDEELGSPTSRALIEREAARARNVLVAEPSAAGALKTARKGISLYRLHCHGRAAHAGLEPERGINAMVELSAQVPRIVAFADTAAGTTVTPTLARAGTTVNTVPATAELDIDVRCWTGEEQDRVDAGLRGLVPTLPGARLELHGGRNRPPLESAVTVALERRAQAIARQLGIGTIPTAAVGGGSDGNFTAALGVPTLDGLGAVGGQAHAPGEWIDIDATVQRAALLSRLLAELLVVDAANHPEQGDMP